jgi:hypothetical protein
MHLMTSDLERTLQAVYAKAAVAGLLLLKNTT